MFCPRSSGGTAQKRNRHNNRMSSVKRFLPPVSPQLQVSLLTSSVLTVWSGCHRNFTYFFLKVQLPFRKLRLEATLVFCRDLEHPSNRFKKIIYLWTECQRKYNVDLKQEYMFLNIMFHTSMGRFKLESKFKVKISSILILIKAENSGYYSVKTLLDFSLKI